MEFCQQNLVSKAPPAHLHSATNATKVNQSNIKQQLPLKLSSNSR